MSHGCCFPSMRLEHHHNINAVCSASSYTSLYKYKHQLRGILCIMNIAINSNPHYFITNHFLFVSQLIHCLRRITEHLVYLYNMVQHSVVHNLILRTLCATECCSQTQRIFCNYNHRIHLIDI